MHGRGRMAYDVFHFVIDHFMIMSLILPDLTGSWWRFWRRARKVLNAITSRRETKA